MRLGFACGLWVALGFVAGCGPKNPPVVPVSGTIKVNGIPSGDAFVTFIPEGTTEGNGGAATADGNGVYHIQNPQGIKGLYPGTYKVTVSIRRNLDGSKPDPNVPPIESSARETLPPKYSDKEKSDLTATVNLGETKVFDFDLKTVKK